MSFYIAYSTNIKNRKAQNVFSFKDSFLFNYSNNVDNKLFDLSGSHIKNPVISALSYIKHFNIEDVEIMLPYQDAELLNEACEAISEYLLDNDNSIGLLTENSSFYEDYEQIIDRYGITCSVPQLIIKECSPKKAKTTSKSKINVENGRFELSNKLQEPIIKREVVSNFELGTDYESGLSMDKPFKDILMGYLIESGKTNSEVYTKGGITRQVFSNIFTKKDFIPKKDTVICIVIGLELPYNEAMRLLQCAGYTLSRSIVLDTVVIKYLKRGIYDLLEINAELDERGCPLLGWKPRDN